MDFLVQIKVFETVTGMEADKQVRQTVGTQLEHLVRSGKVKASGLLGGVRGGFLLMEINAPEDLYSLLGPEIYGYCQVDAHPVIPVQVAGELFQQWTREGR